MVGGWSTGCAVSPPRTMSAHKIYWRECCLMIWQSYSLSVDLECSNGCLNKVQKLNTTGGRDHDRFKKTCREVIRLALGLTEIHLSDNKAWSATPKSAIKLDSVSIFQFKGCKGFLPLCKCQTQLAHTILWHVIVPSCAEFWCLWCYVKHSNRHKRNNHVIQWLQMMLQHFKWRYISSDHSSVVAAVQSSATRHRSFKTASSSVRQQN